ncbi:MAG: hypothetical protein IPN01_00365 [Deltaproteobacteria bacterium]|nr:hypothetical protein [Deltaproteobacteria bacterium]
MATYDPYIKRAAGDFIAADDWNEIQRLGRQDLAEHDHTGGLKGPKLTGDAIAADATLNIKRLNADEIKLADRLLGKRLSDVEELATAALSAKGGAIDGSLTIGGDLTVKGKINGSVSTGGGGGATFAMATLPETKSLKTETFSATGLTATITLTEACIITATANISVADLASAQFAFVAVLSSGRVTVPFVPREASTSELEREVETSRETVSGTSIRPVTTAPPTSNQIDPTTYYKLLATAAKLGDDGVGVGATIKSAATKTTILPLAFTQVTALPAGTYSVALAVKGEVNLTSASIFVVTQTADLTAFDTTR